MTLASFVRLFSTQMRTVCIVGFATVSLQLCIEDRRVSQRQSRLNSSSLSRPL